MKKFKLYSLIAGLLVSFSLIGVSCASTNGGSNNNDETNQNGGEGDKNPDNGGDQNPDIDNPDPENPDTPDPKPEPETPVEVTTILNKDTCVNLVETIKNDNQKVYAMSESSDKLNNVTYNFVGGKLIGFVGNFPGDEGLNELKSFQVKLKSTTTTPIISTVEKLTPKSIEISYFHSEGDNALPKLFNVLIDDAPLSYGTGKNEDTGKTRYDNKVYRNVVNYTNLDKLNGNLNFVPEDKAGVLYFEYIKIVY